MKRKLESGSSLYLFITAIFIMMLASAVPAADQNPKQCKGRLCLISMGAGDRDNMTVRAQKTVLAADVVLTGKHLRQKFADLLQGKEKVILATLDTILDTTKDMELPFEHLIYVGDFLK
jgi:precorrin-4 methylase